MMREFLTRARFFLFRRSPAELDEELRVPPGASGGV